MLESEMSNSMRRTSWKWDGCETLWLDVMRAGKGRDWDGTLWSRGILAVPTPFEFSVTSSRKWNVYVGGSLREKRRASSEHSCSASFRM